MHSFKPFIFQEYEDIAVRLGKDAAYRKAIRAKVWKSRISSSLFDTKNYARDLEGVYTKIWNRHSRGLPTGNYQRSTSSHVLVRFLE
jgi:hypothetical protein